MDWLLAFGPDIREDLDRFFWNETRPSGRFIRPLIDLVSDYLLFKAQEKAWRRSFEPPYKLYLWGSGFGRGQIAHLIVRRWQNEFLIKEQKEARVLVDNGESCELAHAPHRRLVHLQLLMNDDGAPDIVANYDYRFDFETDLCLLGQKRGDLITIPRKYEPSVTFPIVNPFDTLCPARVVYVQARQKSGERQFERWTGHEFERCLPHLASIEFV